MTPAETAKLLAKASAYDLRTVGRADVLAWHEVLSGVDFDDAMAAVAQHYTENTDNRLMPGHVIKLAREIDRERRKAVREAREETEARAIEADPSRRDRSAEVHDLIQRLRDSLPDGDPDKLRRPEWIATDRRRARKAARDAATIAARAEESPA